MEQVDIEISGVAEGWLQTYEDEFLINKVPTCKVPACADLEAKRDVTIIYPLARLTNGMNPSGAPIVAPMGADPGEEDDYDYDEVTIRYNTIRSKIHGRALNSSKPRIADVKKYVPMCMSELWQSFALLLAATLTNATLYGTARTFAGAALNTKDPSNQKPDEDIEEALEATLRNNGGFERACFIDDKTINILRGRPEYTGAGTGSNSSNLMGKEAFLERFMDVHSLDAVHILGGRVNNSAYGVTPVVQRLFGGKGGLLAFMNLDRRAIDFDVTGGGATVDPKFAPDGGLFCCAAQSHEIHNEVYKLKRREVFMGTRDFNIFAPRLPGEDGINVMGCFFDPVEIRGA